MTEIDHSLYTGGPGDNFRSAGGGNSDAGAALRASEAPYAEFNEVRWARVGADEETLATLLAEHSEMSWDEQVAEGRWIDSVSDSELKDALAEVDTAAEDAAGIDDYDGTVEEVLAKVGNDVAKAQAAILHEHANKGRVTLLTALESIVTPT